ncbi:hypothetical protein V6N11_056922 [Hibiscus sabdariffa]|uniref:Uncharacterized protein n=1 Tax=Hibiscus sabdariffa TaxID=183260 RepID=A0ABR2T628_9ROSI
MSGLVCYSWNLGIFLADYDPKTSKPDPTPPSSPPHSLPKQPPLTPPMAKTIKPQNLIQPCYKKIQKWVKKNPQPETVSQPKQISSVLMFTPTSSTYDKDFPPMEEFTEKGFRHVPKIPTPLQGETTSAAEAILNWQTENAIAQNTTLQKNRFKGHTNGEQVISSGDQSG